MNVVRGDLGRIVGNTEVNRLFPSFAWARGAPIAMKIWLTRRCI